MTNTATVKLIHFDLSLWDSPHGVIQSSPVLHFVNYFDIMMY